MKIPKSQKRYCKYCKKHTEQTIAAAKKRNRSALKHGSLQRAKKRGRTTGFGNLGRYSRPAISKFKRTGAKSSKKADLRYTCKICKKSSVQKQGIRAKKTEIKEKEKK